MSVLAECPFCHKKQSTKNKICSCSGDLDKAKKGKKVKYWINFNVPGEGVRREYVGYSIEEARDADGKRRTQKRENRIFDMLPEAKMTFKELAAWYLDLSKVKALRSYSNVKLCLKNFNKVFGPRIVGDIKQLDLEEYQEKRAGEKKSAATIDMEIRIAKTMVRKALDNDLVAGRTLKAFNLTEKKLKRGSNARERTLSFDEISKLLFEAPPHLRAMIEVALYTGMRQGELRELRWKHIDRKTKFIRLPASMTKENKNKNVPIAPRLMEILDSLVVPINKNTDGHVFIFRGKPITHNTGMKKGMRNACKRAGLSYGRKAENGLTFHDLRRMAKTNMVNAGIKKEHRDTILGHSLGGMDDYYIKPTEEDLTKAMAQYAAWIARGGKTEEEAKKEEDHLDKAM